MMFTMSYPLNILSYAHSILSTLSEHVWDQDHGQQHLPRMTSHPFVYLCFGKFGS